MVKKTRHSQHGATARGKDIIVTASREWKLNLIYSEQVMKYEKTRPLI